MQPVLSFAVPIEAGVVYHFHPCGILGPFAILEGLEADGPEVASGNTVSGTSCVRHTFADSGRAWFTLVAESFEDAVMVVYQDHSVTSLRPVTVASI